MKIEVAIPRVFYPLYRPARYKVCYGGRWGGKSMQIGRRLLEASLTDPGIRLCTRKFQNSITDSVHRLLVSQIDALGLEDYFEVTQHSIRPITGGAFIFKGLQHLSEIKSTEGIKDCWVEEALDLSEEDWSTLTKTIRETGSEIYVSFNPREADDPTYKRFVVRQPNNCTLIKANYCDNPFFNAVGEAERQDDLRKIAEAKTDDERTQAQADYDHTWLGECRRLAQAGILKRWSVEAFETPAETRFFHGADWGFANDPTALVRFFERDKVLYVDQESVGYGVEIDETPQLFDKIDTARRWPIKADCSRPETISFMRRQGFQIEAAEKWPGSVEDGIAHLNGFRRIIIHPRCTHTAHEARHYSFKVDKITKQVLPIIVDANNHCIDAIRYGLDGYIQRRGGLGVWLKLAE